MFIEIKTQECEKLKKKVSQNSAQESWLQDPEQALLTLHVAGADLSPLQAIPTMDELSMSEAQAAISSSPHGHQDPTYFQTCLF